MSNATATAGYFIPASPGKQTPAHITYGELTRKQVEANDYILGNVREQGWKIRLELELEGEVWWAGHGHHADCTAVRAFAFRVLIAKGELKADPADSRRYIAA